MPVDESATIRRIEDVERSMRELGPSIAASFGPVIANLLGFAADSVQALNIAFPPNPTAAVVATVTLTVPDGFTTALVTASMNITAYNNTASQGNVQSFVRIGSTAASPSTSPAAAASQWTGTASTFYKTLSGLTPGDTITITANAAVTSATAWNSLSANGAFLTAQAIFLHS